MVKIRKVMVWAVPALGSATSIELTFTGSTVGLVGDEKTHTDTSMGVQPACLRVKPDKKCLASEFQLSSANVAFSLVSPAGAVIDLLLTFRGSTNNVAQAAQNASVGATVGATFWRGLDGLGSTTNFPPPSGIATA